MWNSLEIKLLCRDHGNDYEVSVSLSLHAHISLSNATTTTTSFNKCIKLNLPRFYSIWHKSEILEQRLYIYGQTEAFLRPLSFQTVFAQVSEKQRTKFLAGALSLNSLGLSSRLALFSETSRLAGLEVRSLYYCNTPTTFYFMSK